MQFQKLLPPLRARFFIKPKISERQWRLESSSITDKRQEEGVKAFLMLPHSDLQELLPREIKKFKIERPVMASWRLTKAKKVNRHPHYNRTPTHQFIFYEPPSMLWISKHSESLYSWMKVECRDRGFTACCKSLGASEQAERIQPTLHTDCMDYLTLRNALILIASPQQTLPNSYKTDTTEL